MKKRVCTKCQEEKPKSNYFRKKYGSEGLDSVCRACKSILKGRRRHIIKECPELKREASETPIYMQIVELLADGEWHATIELQEIAKNGLHGAITNIKRAGFNIESKKDIEVSYGYLYRLTNDKSSRENQTDKFMKLISDNNWHSAEEMAEKFGYSWQNYLKRGRKQGYVFIKKWDFFSKQWCFKLDW